MSAAGGVVGRLGDYFRRQGYEVEVEGDVIYLRSGRVAGVVRVLGYGSGPSDLLSAVIEAATDASAGLLAYVAAQRELSEKVGEHVFRLHGLGLVKYTEMDVVEAVSPRLREVQQPRRERAELLENIGEALEKVLKKVEAIESRLDRKTDTVTAQTVEEGFENRLSDVYARLEALERRVKGLEKLSEEVAEVRQALNQLMQQGRRQETRNTALQEKPSPEPAAPSFLQNNPWLEILSNKGR